MTVWSFKFFCPGNKIQAKISQTMVLELFEQNHMEYLFKKYRFLSLSRFHKSVSLRASLKNLLFFTGNPGGCFSNIKFKTTALSCIPEAEIWGFVDKGTLNFSFIEGIKGKYFPKICLRGVCVCVLKWKIQILILCDILKLDNVSKS